MAGLTTKFEVMAANSTHKDDGELECDADCEDCLQADDMTSKARTIVPWQRIAKAMKKPSLVFDARGLVDIVEMEKLGFTVERIGKVHPDSALFGKFSAFPSPSSLVELDKVPPLTPVHRL